MDQIDTEINGMLKKIKEERQYIEIGYEDKSGGVLKNDAFE